MRPTGMSKQERPMQALAEAEKLPFLETSALKNVNVEEAFMQILGEIYTAATRKLFTEVSELPVRFISLDTLLFKHAGGETVCVAYVF